MTSSNFTGVQFILYHYFLYDYSITDILINYSLIILFTLINNCRSQDNRPRTLANLHTVIFSVLQILCWLLLEAYGVSLVWAGQLGLTLLLLLDWTSALYSVTVCQENKLSPTGTKSSLGTDGSSGHHLLRLLVPAHHDCGSHSGGSCGNAAGTSNDCHDLHPTPEESQQIE